MLIDTVQLFILFMFTAKLIEEVQRKCMKNKYIHVYFIYVNMIIGLYVWNSFIKQRYNFLIT